MFTTNGIITAVNLQTALKKPKLVVLTFVAYFSTVKVLTTINAIEIKNFKMNINAKKDQFALLIIKHPPEHIAIVIYEHNNILFLPPYSLFSIKYPLIQ